MPLSRALVMLVLSLTLATTAAEPLRLSEVLPAGSQDGLYVQRMDDQRTVLLQHNADLLLPPASTMKLLTAVAAKLVLTEDFRFVTQIHHQGKDLVVRFGGDPSLSREHIKQLLQKAKSVLAGTRIQDLWIDDSAFTGHQRALGWPWENLTTCYSAPISAVSIDGNCIHVAVYSDRKPGDKVRVNVPAHQPININASAEVVTSAQQRERRCNLDLTANENNHYQLSGCWPVSKNPLPLKLSVQNPSLFAAAVVTDQIKQLGINLEGKVRIGKPDSGIGKTLALHRSAPLNELLRLMLHRSDNQIADALLKTLGGSYFQLPGSYRNGLSALRQVLKNQAGIDLDNAIIEDGSGLSRSNRLSARQLGQVLHYLFHNDHQLGLLALLPVSGESGTLAHRSSLSQPPLKGQYRGKTGTLFGTKNLAGIFTTAKGEPVLVAQIITNYFPNGPQKGPKPYIRFEQRLYNSLYSDY